MVMMKNMFIAKRDFLRLVVGLLVCFQSTLVMAMCLSSILVYA